ncbi:MAG TPA: hypothetical protein VMU45_07625 [Candidatus Eisenbacteria bacterium]|nr:hypothetical protein [Candidatus Eisenbacteria bacterium]
MQRILLSLSLAALAVAFVPHTSAQNLQDALHAPDGNSFTRIVGIFIAPIFDAPFTATVSTEWTRETSNRATIVVKNRRLVARDSQGHVFEERRRFVPAGSSAPSLLFRMDYVDPAKRTRTVCFPANRQCDTYNVFVPPGTEKLPVGPMLDGRHYLSREDLGKAETEGLETIGTRETITTTVGANGNDREVSLTKEFWYSPRLGINLVVRRMDPLQGTQVFTVSNITLAEPDARLFVMPAGYKAVDRRVAQSSQTR